MGTTGGSGERVEAGMMMGGIGPWLKLFLGISGGAVAIAVALGLLVLLTTSAAQAQVLAQDHGSPGSDGSAPAPLHRLQAHQSSGLILMTGSGPMVAPLQSTSTAALNRPCPPRSSPLTRCKGRSTLESRSRDELSMTAAAPSIPGRSLCHD